MSSTVINFSVRKLTKRLFYQNVQVVFWSIVKERRQLRGEGLQPLAVGKVEGKQLCIEDIVYWKRHSEKRQGVCWKW
jgi:hypothetical protein